MIESHIPEGWVQVDEPQPGDRLLADMNWVYVGPSQGWDNDKYPHVVECVGDAGDYQFDRYDSSTEFVRRVPTVTIELPRDDAEWWVRSYGAHVDAGLADGHTAAIVGACRAALGAE